MRSTKVVTLTVLATCVASCAQGPSRWWPKPKPDPLPASLEQLMMNGGQAFKDFVSTIPFVHVVQGPVDCTNGTLTTIPVQSIQNGHNLTHGKDFKSGNGYVVAMIINTSSCTIADPSLEPQAVGYWIIRHDPNGPANSKPQAILVKVTSSGIVSVAPWSKKYVSACPGSLGVDKDAAQVRADTDKCNHSLDKLLVQTDTTRSHDPTLWMSCSLTCCYADAT